MTQELISSHPGTGDEVGRFPVHSADDVFAAVERAREAAQWWSALSFDERKKRLLAWDAVLARRIGQLANIVAEETGKPDSDARLEATLAIEHLSWAAKNAEKYLKSETRSPGLLMANMKATVEFKPLGVVGVIGPWNYPVFTPMGSIAYALAAGNTVVFKPSEYTPGVGVWLAQMFAEVVTEAPVFQVVTGFAETGAALCRSRIDKLAFTGSSRTGRKVAQACAENLVPVLMECGGKDAVIVDQDADLEAAAENTLWSAMANAGQTCIAAERVYVHAGVAERFKDLLVEQAKQVRPGIDAQASYGPATMKKQLEIIKSHIEDAIRHGGKALLGGPESVDDTFAHPVILADVPEVSTAVCEETFGPTLVVNTVHSMDEAIALANQSSYGLGASVWGKARADEIASKIRSGMVSINSALAFAAIPTVPFGGVGDSGYGRIHGPEGLKEFTYAHSIVKPRFKAPLSFTTFKRTKTTDKLITLLTQLLHGRTPKSLGNQKSLGE